MTAMSLRGDVWAHDCCVTKRRCLGPWLLCH